MQAVAPEVWFAAFLAGALVGSLAICALLGFAIASWSRSLTRMVTSGATRSGTGAHLSNDSAAMVTASISAGSLNSSGTVALTSTPSLTIGSSATGSLEHGPRLSDAMETAAHVMNAPELALSASDLAAEERSHTLASTPRSSTKRPCQLCSRIRALVAGGVSSATGGRWQLPLLSGEASPKPESSLLRSIPSEITSKPAANEESFGKGGSTGAKFSRSQRKRRAAQRSPSSKR